MVTRKTITTTTTTIHTIGVHLHLVLGEVHEGEEKVAVVEDEVGLERAQARPQVVVVQKQLEQNLARLAVNLRPFSFVHLFVFGGI